MIYELAIPHFCLKSTTTEIFFHGCVCDTAVLDPSPALKRLKMHDVSQLMSAQLDKQIEPHSPAHDSYEIFLVPSADVGKACGQRVGQCSAIAR